MMMSQNILEEYWGLPPIPEGLLNIFWQKAPATKIKIPLFLKSNCWVYWTPMGRRIEYVDGSVVHIQFSKRSYLIETNSRERFLELGKLIYLSVYGLCQELKGSMRIHAAVIGENKKHRIIWGLPNAGKTTLCFHFMKTKPTTVLTDELCLFDGQFSVGVPLKLHDKNSQKLKPLKNRDYDLGFPRRIYILKRHTGSCFRTKRLTKFEEIGLFCHLIVGSGLHQMAEYQIRLSNFFLLSKIFLLRIRRTVQLFRRTQRLSLLVPDLKFDQDSKF